MGGTPDEKSRISRRNALKAGVATGVGAAAFAGPQIGMLGSTPAYAMVCSQPFTEFIIDSTNTSCDSSCGGNVDLKPINGTFGSGGVFSSPWPNSGECSGVAQAQITVPAGFAVCRVTAYLHFGNSFPGVGSPDIVGQSTSVTTTGTTPVTIPAITCVPPNNKFWTAVVECNPDPDC